MSVVVASDLFFRYGNATLKLFGIYLYEFYVHLIIGFIVQYILLEELVQFCVIDLYVIGEVSVWKLHILYLDFLVLFSIFLLEFQIGDHGSFIQSSFEPGNTQSIFNFL